MEVQICAVCSLARPPLLPLPNEHRQLFAAIVSPFITTSDLNACYLLLCVDCQMEMLSVHHFQKRALVGVRKLKNMLRNLNNATLEYGRETITKQTTNDYESPVFLTTPQTAMVIIKIEPEIRLPEANTVSESVLAPRDSNSVTGEDDLKSDPDSTPEFLDSDFEFESPKLEPAKTEFASKSELQSEFDFKLEPESKSDPHTESANLEQNFRPITQNRITSKSVLSYVVLRKVQSAKRAGKESNTASEKPKQIKFASVTKISKEVLLARLKANAAEKQTKTKADAAAAVAAKKDKIRSKRIRKKPKRAQCPHCDKFISNKWSLRAHYHRVHAEKKPVNCDVCDKECRNVEVLRVHKYSHTPRVKTEPKVFCEECSYTFASESCYNRHLNSLKHTPREQYKFECEFCKKKYPNKGLLLKHVDFIHRGVRKFKCDSCDKAYAEKRRLQRHIRSSHEHHVREKTYICEQCGKAFLLKKTLMEHLLVHQGLRPYKCKLCPADFSYSAALYTHNQLKHLKNKRKKSEDKNDEVEKTAKL